VKPCATLAVFAAFLLQGCATNFVHDKVMPYRETAQARDDLRWTTSAEPRVLDCPFLGRDGNRPRWLYQLRDGDTPLYLVLDTTYWQSNYIVDTVPSGTWTKEPSAPALQLVVADAALPGGFEPTRSPQGDPTRALLLLNTPSYVRKQTPVGTFEGGQGQACVYFTAPGETRYRCRGLQTSVASSWTFRPERGLYALSGAIDLALSPAYLVVGIVCLPWFLSGGWMPQIRY
jgi:hypothetical protein